MNYPQRDVFIKNQLLGYNLSDEVYRYCNWRFIKCPAVVKLKQDMMDVFSLNKAHNLGSMVLQETLLYSAVYLTMGKFIL
jgi:hypothetical protein